MKNVLKSPQSLMVAGLLIIAFTAVAWQNNDKKSKTDTSTAGNYTGGDTSRPGKHGDDKDEFRMKDLDDVMINLDIQLKHLDVQLKNLDINLSKQLQDVFANIDLDEMNKDLKNELSKIDVDKLNNDIHIELNKIDVDKIKNEVANSLRDAREQLNKVDKEELQNNMRELRQKLNGPEFKQRMDEAMQKAKSGIDKAKKELQQLKEFTDELEKDKLIDKKKGYSIEWKNNGELYINGNKQPKEITDKYRKYYKKDGYKIHMNNDDDDKEGESM